MVYGIYIIADDLILILQIIDICRYTNYEAISNSNDTRFGNFCYKTVFLSGLRVPMEVLDTSS